MKLGLVGIGIKDRDHWNAPPLLRLRVTGAYGRAHVLGLHFSQLFCATIYQGDIFVIERTMQLLRAMTHLQWDGQVAMGIVSRRKSELLDIQAGDLLCLVGQTYYSV